MADTVCTSLFLPFSLLSHDGMMDGTLESGYHPALHSPTLDSYILYGHKANSIVAIQTTSS